MISAARRIRKQRKEFGTNYSSKTAASRNGCSARSRKGEAVGSTMKRCFETRCGRLSRTLPTRKSMQSQEPWHDDEHAAFGESRGDEDAGESADFRKPTTIRSTPKRRTAIRFCNRQWTFLCGSIQSSMTRSRDMLLRWPPFIKAPATRWAAWRSAVSSCRANRELWPAHRAAQACTSRRRVCPRRPVPTSIGDEQGTV